MPVPTQLTQAPYTVSGGEVNDDGTTVNDGQVTSVVTLTLTGQISQVQADWATLIATSLTCPSALISTNDAQS